MTTFRLPRPRLTAQPLIRDVLPYPKYEEDEYDNCDVERFYRVPRGTTLLEALALELAAAPGCTTLEQLLKYLDNVHRHTHIEILEESALEGCTEEFYRLCKPHLIRIVRFESDGMHFRDYVDGQRYRVTYSPGWGALDDEPKYDMTLFNFSKEW